MNLKQRIGELLLEHITLRGVSCATGVDVGYLSHLWVGTKTNPSNETCKRLGLQKRMAITYTALIKEVEDASS